MDKKAAIELSITGVVVLIIAITVLGLVLVFVRNYFEKVQQDIPDIQEQQRNRVLDEMERSGELLDFRGKDGNNVRSVKGISVGSPAWFALGIKNTATNQEDPDLPVCYRVAFYCVRPYDENGECTEDEPTEALVGGKSNDGDTPTEPWFTKLLSEHSIDKGRKKVSELMLNVEKAKPDSYEMELRVYKAEDNANCDGASFSEDPWKRQSFTIEITG